MQDKYGRRFWPTPFLLRWAQCGELLSVKPWRLEDVLGNPWGGGDNVNGKCLRVPNAAGSFTQYPGCCVLGKPYLLR